MAPLAQKSSENNHTLEHKRMVIRTLMNRVNRLVSDETELDREKEHIRKSLQVILTGC